LTAPSRFTQVAQLTCAALILICSVPLAAAPASPAQPPAAPPDVPSSLADVKPLGNYSSLEQLRQCLIERMRAGEDVSRAQAAIDAVVARLDEAKQLLKQGALAAVRKAFADIQGLAARAYWMSYPSRQGELRGIWACGSVEPSWDDAMRTIREANLNAVYPYMCTPGAAWYRSDYAPMVSDVDRLSEAVAAGQKWGVPVHARMLVLYAMCAPAAVKDQFRQQARFVVSPKGKTTNWLCPTQPANRRLVVSQAVEMATKYPVAGIQYDYLRYDGEDFCFCPACRAAFQESIGQKLTDLPGAVRSGPMKERWQEWRRAQITTLVRDLHDALRTARPDIIISASVFLNWEVHRGEFGQDWKDWVDRGYVDYVCPMSYTPSNTKFTTYVTRQLGWVAGKVPVCPGIGVNADGMKFPGAQGLLDQITIARNLGAGGWVIFNYDPKILRDYLPTLKLGATSTPTEFWPLGHEVGMGK
jgi:uncharacterized lipoprotein YddW (UPF0748 family)